MDYQDKLENFLYEWFTWQHVQAMSDAQKVRLEKLVDPDENGQPGINSKASGKQKLWWRYLRSASPQPGEATYVDRFGKAFWWRKDKSEDPQTGQFRDESEIPVQIQLTDDDWKAMYRYFRDNFRAMDKNREGIDGTFSKPFLDKWFGTGLMFGPAKPKYKKEGIDAIQALNTLLNTGDRDANIAKLERLMEMGYRGKPADLNDGFYAQLADPGRGDAKFWSKLAEVFGILDSNINTLAVGQFANAKAGQILSELPGLEDIVETVQNSREEEDVDPRQIEDMRLNYPELMFGLFDKEARQKDFTAGGEPNLVTFINSAKSNANYTDNEFNKIVPKYEDQRNLRETVKKKWDDYREGTWDKLGNRHRAHTYSSQSGQEWVEAIYKLKIKPTDGIEKILAEKDKIKELFTGNNTNSVPQFNWGMKALKDIKETSQADKMFAGIFKDATKMNALVKELIQKAAREDKLEHCKSTLEMLYIMQYGPFTSDVRDKLFGDKAVWTFFGDMPSLKDQKVLTFFAKTTDRVIKFGARVTFEGLNVVWRAYHRRGMSFGKEGRSKFMDKMRDLFEEVTTDPNMTPEQAEQRLRDAEQSLAPLQTQQTNLQNRRNTLTAELSALHTQLTPLRQQAVDLDAARGTAQTQKNTVDTNVANLNASGLTLPVVTNALNQLRARWSNYMTNPADPSFDNFDPESHQAKMEEYKGYVDTFSSQAIAATNLTNATANLNNHNTTHGINLAATHTLLTDIAAKQAEIDANEVALSEKTEEVNQKHVEISTLKEAVASKKKNATQDSKAKIAEELAYYWDFLCSGASDNRNPLRFQGAIRKDMAKGQERIIDGEVKTETKMQWMYKDWKAQQEYFS